MYVDWRAGDCPPDAAAARTAADGDRTKGFGVPPSAAGSVTARVLIEELRQRACLYQQDGALSDQILLRGTPSLPPFVRGRATSWWRMTSHGRLSLSFSLYHHDIVRTASVRCAHRRFPLEGGLSIATRGRATFRGLIVHRTSRPSGGRAVPVPMFGGTEVTATGTLTAAGGFSALRAHIRIKRGPYDPFAGIPHCHDAHHLLRARPSLDHRPNVMPGQGTDELQLS